MTDYTDPLKLVEQISALREEATPGLWLEGTAGHAGLVSFNGEDITFVCQGPPRNRALVAALVNNWPTLATLLQSLSSENERLKEEKDEAVQQKIEADDRWRWERSHGCPSWGHHTSDGRDRVCWYEKPDRWHYQGLEITKQRERAESAEAQVETLRDEVAKKSHAVSESMNIAAATEAQNIALRESVETLRRERDDFHEKWNEQEAETVAYRNLANGYANRLAQAEAAARERMEEK